MKIARKDIIAALDACNDRAGSRMVVTFKRYEICVRRYKNGWRISIMPKEKK